ncbi:hypothetical protein LCGC14_0417060 [marine sediment metagenome]|uniref:Rubredoxin-like domain-containing protein n=1 Tax=marine sediment metagenome TaxID=412755 RepID=A0A0F9TA99_9ZZZZ
MDNEAVQQTYSLNCVECGEVYQSPDGFPEPQLCPQCLEPKPSEDGLLTNKERVTIGTRGGTSFYAWGNEEITTLLEAQRDLTTSIKDPHIKQLKMCIGDLKRQLRELEQECQQGVDGIKRGIEELLVGHPMSLTFWLEWQDFWKVELER